MPRASLIVAVALAAGAVVAVPALAFAQPGVDAIEPLVPIWLARPEYPVIARAARIQGEVEIAAEVGPDGRVTSASVVKGPPLLRDAALEAALEAHFFGRRAGAPRANYALTYAFAFDVTPRPAVIGEGTARMITVEFSGIAIIDYSDITVRGAKCLYMWRCGQEWGGYLGNGYNRVHAAKCLWLWKCDWGEPGHWE